MSWGKRDRITEINMPLRQNEHDDPDLHHAVQITITTRGVTITTI